MTDSGTFIINGAERVIVSQLVRSPSVYFSREVDKKNGKHIITSQVIPTRGTWLEYETDARDVIYCRIDRTRKVPVTTLLRALGLSSDNDIVDLFGEDDYILRTIEKDANKAAFEIVKLLTQGQFSNLLSGANRFNNICWFNKEVSDESIALVTAIALLGATAAQESAVLAEYAELLAAKTKAEYQCGNFIKPFVPKTEKDSDKETKEEKPAKKASKKAKK